MPLELRLPKRCPVCRDPIEALEVSEALASPVMFLPKLRPNQDWLLLTKTGAAVHRRCFDGMEKA